MHDVAASILIVDDDKVLGAELVSVFADHNISCHLCDNWASALAELENWQPQLIVLDQKLGPINTLFLLPEMRQLTAAPILFLTGNQSEVDRVIGLELGADDFLLKPISGRELVARVRAHLRRAHRHEKAPTGEWRIVAAERKVCRPDGTVVPLTSAEFELLQMLTASPGVPIDRQILTKQVLRRSYQADDRSLDNLVHQIRRKFGTSGAGEVIASIRNAGYVFRSFPEV